MGTPKQITLFNSEEITDFDVLRDGKRIVMRRGADKTGCDADRRFEVTLVPEGIPGGLANSKISHQ